MGKRTRVGFTVQLVALLLGLLLLLPAARPAQAQQGAPFVDLLVVDGEINPPVVSYIARGIRRAAEEGATCLIVQLDTPGGLLDSTEEIVRAILNAGVPVVVYVAPRGARAASAGVYITYASHVAAMAPNTHLGAATPVGVGPEGQPAELPEELQRKLEEDALANLRASAQERGRNWEWAERAVREAASATANEALDLNVIEVVADDVDDLLDQLDGRTVTLASGHAVTLQTAQATVRDHPMTILDQLLRTISSPTIAYLLLSIGSLGLWVEFSKPGVQLAGVLGGVCIILGLYGLGTLPVNWAGVVLILIAFILFAFDIFAPTHLVLTTGGVVAFIAGSLLLFQSPDPYLQIPWWVIGSVSGTIGVIVLLILGAVVRGHRRPVVSGPESIIGKVGEVRRPLDPEGLIFVDGALWKARAEQGPIGPGDKVVVIAREGLRLYVRRREETERSNHQV